MLYKENKENRLEQMRDEKLKEEEQHLRQHSVELNRKANQAGK